MTLLAGEPATEHQPPRSFGRGLWGAARARVPIWHGLEALPPGRGRCVAVLGVFDGVHRGHAQLITTAVELSHARELPAVLVTFDPHPARVVGAPRDTAALSSLAQRAEWAGDLGVDAVVVLEFTRELAALTPEQFSERVLLDALGADAVVVGANFTFGARAVGTTSTLRELGRRHGYSAHPVELLPLSGTTCSSTHIRGCLSRGDVAGAALALGRDHEIETRVVAGHLVTGADTAVPAPGRYVVAIAPEDDEPWLGRTAVLTVDHQRRLLPDPAQDHREGSRVLVTFRARVAS
ncbi:cytidyltransferase [Actinomycetospora soli]|uniref:cytidyltransferase n=1 Tax=Actinomycetospora soli TaxID=2893887 RepID=UPI001E612FFE|nr:cytidyltransferase [Actinomycetospora soli]MCD2191274.1 cytidyltransferase [Actinomycetospora soli]